VILDFALPRLDGGGSEQRLRICHSVTRPHWIWRASSLLQSHLLCDCSTRITRFTTLIFHLPSLPVLPLLQHDNIPTAFLTTPLERWARRLRLPDITTRGRDAGTGRERSCAPQPTALDNIARLYAPSDTGSLDALAAPAAPLHTSRYLGAHRHTATGPAAQATKGRVRGARADSHNYRA
jgi:hypothetical protein